MDVNELSGAALDHAVAKYQGFTDYDPDTDTMQPSGKGVWRVYMDDFSFSTDWGVGGPIIEREKIGIWWATHFVDDEGNEYGNHWYAEMGCTDENADSPYCGVTTGPTPLIAAMRCYVASKQGE